MNNELLKIKQDILKNKINNKNNSEYSDAFAFAIKEDLFPIFDKDYLLYTNEEDVYKVDKCTMLHLYVNLQNHFENQDKITFDDAKFTFDKNTLIDIYRYFYLSEKFDKKFWDHFINGKSSSVEVHNGIDKKFSVDELYSI